MKKYLILVENEVTEGHRYDHWEDKTGIKYHYPNIYKNKIIPGIKFIYYRGTRRNNGYGDPEYFGSGTIGNVYLDPTTDTSESKAKWNWYCDIIDYEPFTEPVYFKHNDDYIEKIPQNRWSVAVREIDKSIFKKILELSKKNINLNKPILPEIIQQPKLVTNNLIKPSHNFADKPIKYYVARTHRAKIIGDKGERIVLHYLRGNFDHKKIRWLANEGETPGYDIELIDKKSQRYGIEVKSTTNRKMNNFQLTINEYEAIKQLREKYILAIVTNVETENPEISFLYNVFDKIHEGALTLTPQSFKVELA